MDTVVESSLKARYGRSKVSKLAEANIY